MDSGYKSYGCLEPRVTLRKKADSRKRSVLGRYVVILAGQTQLISDDGNVEGHPNKTEIILNTFVNKSVQNWAVLKFKTVALFIRQVKAEQ